MHQSFKGLPVAISEVGISNLEGENRSSSESDFPRLLAPDIALRFLKQTI